jgi:hypothetical protein
MAELAALPDQQLASAALFFGGQPVIGSRGIESGFGGEALAKFQDLISKVLAHESGGLGQRGIVPNKAASTLHVTNIVRGSFGFLLEEVEAQEPLVATSLKVAVDEASRLLDAFGEPDEEQFRTVVAEIDQRVLGTAQDFFSLMKQSGATLRLVAGDQDRSFGPEAVARAAERATSTTVEEKDEEVSGQLTGVLPDAHQFEFRTNDERGVLRGRVDRVLTTDQLINFNRDLVNVNAIGLMRVKRVRRDGQLVRETFTLQSLNRNESDARDD